MSCTQKQQLVCFPKVRVYKPWFRHFNDHKDFRNEGTVHLFSLMALFSYANFRSNERVINGDRYMEAPGQWICKLGALPRILRVHSKTQALELMEYFQNHGFLTFEILDEEKEILRFTIADWKEHCTHLQYNYYSYKGSGFFFFPLPVGRLLLKTARKEVGIVFSELDAIMDMWLHTILNDPKVRGSEYMPVVYYSNMRGMPLLSYTYLARRWGWSKSRVGRFMLKAGEYGIISRVSFSSSRGSVISMCRYREMIFGDTCEELELSSIGEIIGITKAADLVNPDEGKMDISIETRVPPAHTIYRFYRCHPHYPLSERTVGGKISSVSRHPAYEAGCQNTGSPFPNIGRAQSCHAVWRWRFWRGWCILPAHPYEGSHAPHLFARTLCGRAHR